MITVTSVDVFCGYIFQRKKSVLLYHPENLLVA